MTREVANSCSSSPEQVHHRRDRAGERGHELAAVGHRGGAGAEPRGRFSTISRFSTYPPVVFTMFRSTMSTAIHSR
jgi:hypothetical protein